MKKNRLYFFLLLLIMASCSPVRVVETEAENNFSLSNYQTFGFLSREEGERSLLNVYRNEMTIIQEEVAAELESRGLRQSTAPDLWVNIGTVVEEKETTRETNIRDAPRYIGQRRYAWKSEELVVNRYQLGTVTVELVDGNQNNLLWRGVAEGVVPEKAAKLRKNIAKGAEKLFDQIP